MSGTYEIWLTDDFGRRLAQLDNNLGFTATKVDKSIGSFSMYLPKSFDFSILPPDTPDRMVQIWRKPQSGALYLWQVYFVRKWNFKTQGSVERNLISGPDVKDILRRRIAAAFSGTEYVKKTDYADDMMKQVVRDSQLNTIPPLPTAGTRLYSDFSVQADYSLGPIISKEFSFDKLLTQSGGILPSLQNASRAAGSEVFFDAIISSVTSNSIDFQFVTTINQPGNDRTNDIVFDQERGNLKDPELEFDWSEEENYIYSAGSGEASARNVQQVYDSERYGLSQWNRCEGFMDVSSVKGDDAIRESGRNRLIEGNPKRYFSGIPVDTEGTRFGNWDFGDKVTARYKGYQFPCIIRAISIQVSADGQENVSTRLEWNS